MKENFSLRGGTRRYRYFVCGRDAKRLKSTCPLRHVPAPELERLVVNEIGSLLGTPETLAGVLDEAKGMGAAALPTEKVREALADLVSVWDVMFPVERYRLVRSIVARITIWPDKVKIRFNPAGLEELIAETAKGGDGR